jgi:hypothetical protein
MNTLWWLSFCDNARPRGEQFLGACIVPGEDMVSAVRNAWANGCNPGGEVECSLIPHLMAPRLPPHRIGVLLNRAEAEGIDDELLPLPGSKPTTNKRTE